MSGSLTLVEVTGLPLSLVGKGNGENRKTGLTAKFCSSSLGQQLELIFFLEEKIEERS